MSIAVYLEQEATPITFRIKKLQKITDAQKTEAVSYSIRQHQSRAGGQGQYGSWAEAVTEICSPISSKRPKTRNDYGPTDRLTDGQTDRPT